VTVNREGFFCSRVVIPDSEFNAYRGQGKRPGPPVCYCAIEFFSDGRVIEHRLSAPCRACQAGTVRCPCGS
jgi:hypothetical protein